MEIETLIWTTGLSFLLAIVLVIAALIGIAVFRGVREIRKFWKELAND